MSGSVSPAKSRARAALRCSGVALRLLVLSNPYLLDVWARIGHVRISASRVEPLLALGLAVVTLEAAYDAAKEDLEVRLRGRVPPAAVRDHELEGLAREVLGLVPAGPAIARGVADDPEDAGKVALSGDERGADGGAAGGLLFRKLLGNGHDFGCGHAAPRRTPHPVHGGQVPVGEQGG